MLVLKKKGTGRILRLSSGVFGQTLLKGFVSMLVAGTVWILHRQSTAFFLQSFLPLLLLSVRELISFMCQKAPSISPLLQEVTRCHIACTWVSLQETLVLPFHSFRPAIHGTPRCFR
ncbi:hypothetical protein V8C34DRAFT_286182 [Trichoderma compactum]